ncbi:hypothetical protein DER45DRAFT_580986 [Fusarium avenaceum]|nr:hypothetical protein DER45DRAFT_580986 [Fusarium avenaceum]
MSVVPPTGLLRKLYQDAAQNIESQPSPFWQAWLQRAFREENYAVMCDLHPGKSSRRVDTEVIRYDESDDTLSTVLCIELRTFSASVRQVESQALDAARLCIRANNLESVYVMTTIGASFHCWIVYETDLTSLVSFNGGTADATRSKYIDADSYEAEMLTRFLDTVKYYPPLRKAHIVPSQPLPHIGYQQIAYSQARYGRYTDVQQEYRATTGQVQYTSGMYGEAGPSGALYYSQSPASSVGEYGQISSVNDQFVKVHVNRVAHSKRSTEYFFNDFNGIQRKTFKDDWREVTYKGYVAWLTTRRGVTYYTRDRIG